MGGVAFGILGPLEVRIEGSEPVGLGGLRQRALLVVLLLHANQVVSTDLLIDQLWPDQPPATALHTIQVFVSRLRRVLGPAGVRLATRPPGYVLEVRDDELDAERCQRLYARGQRALAAGSAKESATLLREALGLWRGPPLADFTYESFAQANVARLEELRVSCREELIEAELALGRHAAVVADLEALVREHRLRERPRGQLMLALYRAGRQAEALEVFQQARRTLVEELAVEPSGALRKLEQAILRQDPALQAPAPEPVTGSAPTLPDAAPPAPPANVPSAARKIVTALACEVSTTASTGGSLDPEVRREVMSRCFLELEATVSRHGGVVEQLMRGAWLAVFGVPRLHEDDAVRAVRAAAEMRERLPAVARGLGAELVLRAGLNTGLVLAEEGEILPTGEPLDVAAVLAHGAAPGEILLAPETLRLVSDAVQVEWLAGSAQPGSDREELDRAVRLLAVHPTAQGVARRLDSRLVDRQTELQRLRDAWDRVRAQAGCQLFTLLGAAGVGKSRLVAELLSTAGEATVLAGRCLPYGDGITFWPIVEALAPVAERAQTVRDRLRSGGSATPEELFWEVRGLLESLAAERAVILYIDDLQWGEPMLLDLIEHVVDLSRHAPILVLCTARVELYEERPSWGGGKLNATTVLLEPLGRADCETLVAQVAAGLALDVRARLVTASEGNPLFVEEMAALARERGTVAVPPTIQALLAARLENLPVAERELLQRGAIVGEIFDAPAVRELAGGPEHHRIDSLLASLMRKDLIRPVASATPNSYRFRHLLIRDAAYDGLPKATRAQLHARYAHWLEATAHELLELDEIAGWHIEQAVLYQRELGRDPDTTLERLGAVRLHTAGLRARERSDAAAARSLLKRAHALAERDDALRIRIGLDLAEQLLATGELQWADELLAAAERAEDSTGLAALTRFEWLVRVRPEGAVSTLRGRLPGILRQLAANGDERGVAKAHLAAREMEVMLSRATPAADEAKLAAEHARLAGDEGLRSRALGLYITSIMYGRQDAAAMSLELAAIAPAEPGSFLAARLDLGQAELARLEGRFDEARAGYGRAIEGFRTLGMPEDEAACEADLARAELSAGDPHAALAALGRSDAVLAKLGERSRRSTTRAHMAQAHAMLGDLDTAREAVERAEELGAPEDVLNFSITHQVRARLALADGDEPAAVRWARSAVEHALRTDYVVFQANAMLAHARIEAALGHLPEATGRAREARDLFSGKGDRPGVRQAEELLEELGRPRAPDSNPPRRPARR